MEPIEFMGMELAPLNAPTGTEDSVSALPFKRVSQKITVRTAEGPKDVEVPTVVSCWYLSDEEIEKLITTKVIWLGVWGETQPPVYLTTERPF